MKLRQLLPITALAGVLIGVVLYMVHPPTLDTLVALAASATSAFAPLWQWLRQATAQLTTTQIVIGAGAAWFIFVLALVLLARAERPEPSTAEPPQDARDAAPRAPPPTPYRAPAPRSLPTAPPRSAPRSAPRSPPRSLPRTPPLARVPPLPARSSEEFEPLEYLVFPDESSSGGVIGAPAAASVSSPGVERRVERESLPLSASDLSALDVRRGRAPRRHRGRLLALAGVAVAGARRCPYGVFIVAEDVGAAHDDNRDDNRASQRAVEVIAEQLAPCLANIQSLGNEHLAALLKLATIRASIDLLQQSLRTATNLQAKVTGAMIVGEAVHVVNIGDCRTYLFRRGSGLTQLTTDHSVVSCLAQTELLQPEAVYTHPRRDQVYRCIGDSQTGVEAQTIEVSGRPGDLLLLCSPGLWQALRQPQIEAILRAESDPLSAAEALAREGASRAGADDFSVIVVRPRGEWVPEFGIPASLPGALYASEIPIAGPDS